MFWNFSRALRGPRPAQGWRWRSTPEDAVALAERPLHPGAELQLDDRHPARRRFHLLAPPSRGLQGAVGVLAVRQLLARRIAGRHGIFSCSSPLARRVATGWAANGIDRKSTRLNSSN